MRRILYSFVSALTLLLLAGCGPASPDTDIPVEAVPEPGPQPDPDDLKPAAGATVYGRVTAGGRGLGNVVVSDGAAVCVTDAGGVFQLSSAKKNGYVFVSLPSGYRAASDGVFPKFFSYLKKGPKVAERVDFPLTEEPGQDRYQMIVLGDMQLADRSGDLSQFARFVRDLDNYVKDNPGEKIYALTLGDMSWDTHWKNYTLSDYRKEINKLKSGIRIFHAMGNHDHMPDAVGNFESDDEYRKVIGPNYYSFNIGRQHYVVLDDIYTVNDGSGSPSYEDRVDEGQLEWLKKDLSYIPYDTPLVVALHAPLYKNSGKNSLDNASELVSILSKYDDVLVQSGHTHILYNVDKRTESHIFEQNSGAICATWWYTGYDVPWLHIGRDGSAGGYRICSFDGTEVRWRFKGIEKPLDYQFRSYDRNMICMNSELCTPEADAEHKARFDESVGEYAERRNDNLVYINVWDYDPSWKVEVFENGRALEVKNFTGYDPLHVLAYNAVRANMNRSLSFPAKETRHLFKAQAGSPDTTLEIKVTDRFGRVYKETMTRPRPFTLEEYNR